MLTQGRLSGQAWFAMYMPACEDDQTVPSGSLKETRMRPVRDVSKEENYRVQVIGPGMTETVREPVEPEPVGTLLLLPFRVVGYDTQGDGSCTARLEHINTDGSATGGQASGIALRPTSALVVAEEEIPGLFETCDAE